MAVLRRAFLECEEVHMRERVRQFIYSICLVGIAVICFMSIEAMAAEDGLTEAKNGIVEILSGFTDAEGVFYSVKTSSGFLVRNADGDTYLLTTNHCVAMTNEEKTAYCDNNNLKIDINNAQNLIRVVVKGDVTSDAAIVAQSAENDYCLLSVSNVINEKSALRLGNNTELTTGMTVYAMGFEDDAVSKGAEFTSIDVSVREGTIQNLEANQDGTVYLQHSARITSGNSGGPLLNAEGYVVGMNNSAKSKPEEGIYFSFPINEIREVLDNYDVRYSSLEKENAMKKLEILYEESKKKYDSGNYKRNSLSALEEVLKQAEELKAQPEISEEDIQAALTEFKAADKKLQKKMAMKKKVMVGLGVIIILLLLYFLKIILAYRRESNLLENKKDTEREQAEERKENPESFQETYTEKRGDILQADKKKHADNSSGLLWNHESDSDRTMVLGINKRASIKTGQPNSDEEKFLMRNEEAMLVRQRESAQPIAVTRPIMNIGKNADKTDITITGNPAVSRVHAQVIWKEQKYYIRDLESANGTFLNNGRIRPNENVELNNEDRLMFADEEYEFKIFRR